MLKGGKSEKQKLHPIVLFCQQVQDEHRWQNWFLFPLYSHSMPPQSSGEKLT